MSIISQGLTVHSKTNHPAVHCVTIYYVPVLLYIPPHYPCRQAPQMQPSQDVIFCGFYHQEGTPLIKGRPYLAQLECPPEAVLHRLHESSKLNKDGL